MFVPSRMRFTFPTLEFFGGCLTLGPQGFVSPHGHDSDHAMLLLADGPAGQIEYEVLLHEKDGKREAGQAGGGPFRMVWVPRGVIHSARVTNGKTGYYICIFSRFDERGFHEDPKTELYEPSPRRLARYANG